MQEGGVCQGPCLGRHGRGGHNGVEVAGNTPRWSCSSLTVCQSPNCPSVRQGRKKQDKPAHSSSSPPPASEEGATARALGHLFRREHFHTPILAGAELLSSFIDEDTGAHWHPAFIYMVTTGDRWGERGCCDYLQGHGVSVGGT